MTLSEQAADQSPPRRRGKASLGRLDWSTWPTYQAAGLGLRDHWYPVMWSRDVGRRPIPIVVSGEKIVVGRNRGKVWALADRCPHRGVPLHLGSVEFPGTISCAYHGWTFDTASGVLCAAITDGPRSPIVGKVSVARYPVEERLGLVWIYIAQDPTDRDRPVPPLDDDLPAELVAKDATVVGRIEPGRGGNWRYATENGFDEGHAKYLHRHALWTLFRVLPVWNETKVMRSDDERWVIRRQVNSYWEETFPGLGTWTQRRWWKVKRTSHGPFKGKRAEPTLASLDLPAKASVGLPGVVRIAYSRYVHYEWAVAEGTDSHRYVQLLVSFARNPLEKLWFRLKYRLFIRWVFHGQFTGQDAWMVDVMEVPPERLYRPDSSVLEWRRFVEDREAGRQGAQPTDRDD